jgi:quercetin dioxygenase-like cupin family protein
MAYQNKVIYNPITKHSIRFIQTTKDTKGELLDMESTYESKSTEPPPHYHPFQQETFVVLEGEMTVRVAGRLKILRPGDRLEVRKNVVHSMWNDSGKKVVMNWKVQPALETEYFLENSMGLAADGKTGPSGLPGILQTTLLGRRFSHVFRLAKPPHAILSMLFMILTPFAYLKGLRPAYLKYQD